MVDMIIQGSTGDTSLANLSFTAYLPTNYAERLRPQGAGTVTVTLFVNGNPVGNNGNPYVYNTVGQKTDFSIADPAGGQITIWDPDRITYQVDLEAADFGGGFALDTPIVEDVTLTFFLPRTEILLQERLFD